MPHTIPTPIAAPRTKGAAAVAPAIMAPPAVFATAAPVTNAAYGLLTTLLIAL